MTITWTALSSLQVTGDLLSVKANPSPLGVLWRFPGHDDDDGDDDEDDDDGYDDDGGNDDDDDGNDGNDGNNDDDDDDKLLGSINETTAAWLASFLLTLVAQ